MNWGLVALAGLDLAAAVSGLGFGETNAAAGSVVGLLGLGAAYQIAQPAGTRPLWSAVSA